MVLPDGVVKMRKLQHQWRDERYANGRKDLFSDGLDICHDIPYMDDLNERHTLDLFSPIDSGRLPVIVEIHGGGFIAVEKEINRIHSRWMALQGFKVVNGEYTIFPEGSFRMILQEMANIIRWIENNTDSRGFDLEHIYMTGDSAGGFLVLLYAMMQGSEEVRAHFGTEMPHTVIKAVAPTAPAIKIPKDDNGEVHRLLSMMYPDGNCEEAEPWLDIPELMKISEYPPLFVNTTPTDNLTYDACVELKRYLEENGRPFLWKEYHSRGNKLDHVFNVLYPEYPESIEANTDMLEYFRKY